MEIDKETRIAYAEIISFINLLPQKEQEKIPKKIIEFFKAEMDKTIKRELTTEISLEDQNLKNATWDLIAILYLKYLCEDEEEKKELAQIYSENERLYRREIKEKYNPEKIFKTKLENDNIKQEELKNLPTVVKKENFIQKIIKFVSKLFNKNT